MDVKIKVRSRVLQIHQNPTTLLSLKFYTVHLTYGMNSM